MIFYIIFFLVICFILLGVTLAGKDYFPFSYYPMFSARRHLQNVRVLRLAMENKNGDLEWWQHEAYRYPEFVGRKLLKFYNQTAGANANVATLIKREKQKLLLEVLRLVELEKQSACFKAFHLIERTVDNQMEIIDKSVEIISFSELKSGKVS